MTDGKRLRGILEVVEESMAEPDLDGAGLAGRAYLSRYHFDRLVRAALGEPPGMFRRRLLLERAAHRLTVGTNSIIEVAEDAGYISPDAFTRAFARAYGVTPSDYRRGSRRNYRLPTVNGIHFHPPEGLRFSTAERSNTMDVLTGMYKHHIQLTVEIINRLDQLDEPSMDRVIELSVESIDEQPTLRRLVERLVRQLEMWTTAVEGGSQIPAGGASVPQLRERLSLAEPRFRAAVVRPIEDGRADETFIDATCAPPHTFSLGGVLAHVLTFSAVRRTLAIGALASAGISDLGSGDPMGFVGGVGEDASTITRNFA